MRVLIVLSYFYCPSQPIGGAERQALRLAQELQNKQVPVTVVTGLWDWGQPHRETVQGIPVRRHFTAWGMFNIKGLRKFSQYFYLLSLFFYLIRHRNEYDIIHCHSAKFEASISVMAGKLLHKPTLVRSMASGAWGDLAAVRRDRSLWGTGWMLSKIQEADAIVALNQQVVDEMLEIGVAKDKILHIPNGVDLGVNGHHRDSALDDSIVIAFVGRLHPQKRVAMLLQALKLVLQQRPDLPWQLKLAGTGPLDRKLKALADELAISRQVEFLGYVADVGALLDRSDLFVLPSASEGISNALLEAMARGLPCVVTDIPGNNEVIQNGENGILVKVDDAEALAKAILGLAADDELRERLGRQARQTVETKYLLAGVTAKYMQLYEKLLLNGRGQVKG